MGLYLAIFQSYIPNFIARSIFIGRKRYYLGINASGALYKLSEQKL